jgi:hypothetical protein
MKFEAPWPYLCTHYRRFIFGFANITKPPTKLTEEKHAFQWAPGVEIAFQTPKEARCISFILVYPQLREGFVNYRPK